MKQIFNRVGLAALALCGLFFLAATTPNSIITPQTPNLKAVSFVQGTDVAGTYKTVYAGGTNGSKITALWLTSNDGSASHLINIQISSSSSAHCSPQSGCYAGMAITLPVNAGFANGAPAVNALSATNWPGLPVDSDGNPYIYLPSTSYTIEMTFTTALTASTDVNGIAIGADF